MDIAKLSIKEREEFIAHTIKQMTEQGKSLKEILDIDSNTLEEIYSLARSHYMQGNYKEALSLFQVLGATDPFNNKYVFGFGATCHQMKLYYDAIVAFGAALNVEPTNPEISFYLGDSFYHVDMLKEAEECFDLTIQLCGDNKEFNSLKEQSIILKNSLTEKK